MSELISALVNVKGPFTLFAFLALLALVAFRTRQVPELFFSLLKEKLTREKFSQLTHRFMFYGFTIFLVLCAVSVTGQILAYKIKAGPASKEAGGAEIQNSNLPDEQKQKATVTYQEGIADIDRDKIADAIKKLEESVAQIPTLSAHFTLAYLYQRDGDNTKAKQHADEAYSMARERKDALAIAKAEQLRKSITGVDKPTQTGVDKSTQECAPLLGPTAAELPKGASFCDKAPTIGPGLYVYGQAYENNSYQYFKIDVKQGQSLIVRFRTADDQYARGGVDIYDAECSPLQSERVGGGSGSRSAKGELQFKASDNAQHYLSVWSNMAGSVYSICVP